MELPSGTVTFLFTDVEGSTRLLQALGDGYVDALNQHSRIIEDAVSGNDGLVVNTEGDAYFCVFHQAPDAAAAAVEILLGLASHDWPNDGEFRVRIGFHTGDGVLGAADYVGIDVHRAARISASGHGGQALLSAETHALVADHLPNGVTTTDLGDHNLKDLPEPEHLFQLVIPGRESTFPALRTGAKPPLPLPPLVAPLPTAAPTASVAASGGSRLLGGMSRGRIVALSIIGGLVAGLGIGAAAFGGGSACEVCAEPPSQAETGALPGTVTSTAATPDPTAVRDDPSGSATTSTTIQKDSDASGTWIFAVNVIAVTGLVCQKEIGDVYEREVTISGPDDALVVVGLDDLTDPDDPAWTGTFSGSKLVFGGTRAEDDGLTTATFEMTLSGDGSLLEGFEAWTWDWTSQGETGTCTDGASTVTATRAP